MLSNTDTVLGKVVASKKHVISKIKTEIDIISLQYESGHNNPCIKTKERQYK